MTVITSTKTEPEALKNLDSSEIKLPNDEKTETRDSGSDKDIEKDAAASKNVLDESKILSGRKLVLAFTAMMLSILLIALGK